MKTLKEVACGKTVTVKKITGEGPVKRRIMDMGITKGVEVFVRNSVYFYFFTHRLVKTNTCEI